MKTCTTCGETKAPDAFYTRKRGGGQPLSWCKACSSAKAKEYREGNRDRLIAQCKAYRKAHKEKHGRGPPGERGKSRPETLQRHIDELSRRYVVGVIRRRRPELSTADIPAEMIEAVRLHLRLVRTLKGTK